MDTTLFEIYVDSQDDPFLMSNLKVLIINNLSSIMSLMIEDKLLLQEFCQKQKNILKVITKFCRLNVTDLICILTYLKRFKYSLPNFTFDYNHISYILITVCVIYCKMYHDRVYNDSYYCHLSKMKISTLNSLEIIIVTNLPLIISEKDFTQVYMNTINTM